MNYDHPPAVQRQPRRLAPPHDSETGAAVPTTPIIGVYTGRRLVGFVLRRGCDGCEALDLNGHSLGLLVDEIAAVSALLTRRVSA
jgi:hypothetical protein